MGKPRLHSSVIESACVSGPEVHSPLSEVVCVIRTVSLAGVIAMSLGTERKD